MSGEFKEESKGFFEKFWEIHSPKRLIGEKIWDAGWTSAFRFMAPRIAQMRLACFQSYIEWQKLGHKAEYLKEIFDDKSGYEQPLIDELIKFQKFEEEISIAAHSFMSDADFRQFILAKFKKD